MNVFIGQNSSCLKGYVLRVIMYSKEQKKLKCYCSYFNTAWSPVTQNHFWQSLLKSSNCIVMAESVLRKKKHGLKIEAKQNWFDWFDHVWIPYLAPLEWNQYKCMNLFIGQSRSTYNNSSCLTRQRKQRKDALCGWCISRNKRCWHIILAISHYGPIFTNLLWCKASFWQSQS